MFRTTLCSSSGGQLYEYNFWYNHSVLVAVRTVRRSRWNYSAVPSWPAYRTATNTRVIIPDVSIQLSSWRWAQSCSKHVEDLNKHIIEETVRQVGYLPQIIRRCTVRKIYNLNIVSTDFRNISYSDIKFQKKKKPFSRDQVVPCGRTETDSGHEEGETWKSQ